MKAMKCDRCGKFFTTDEEPDESPIIMPPYRSGMSLDLCAHCVDSFNSWLHTDYYFEEQVKLGHGIPKSEQQCSRCAYWDYESTPRKCSIGREYRDPCQVICDRWKPN